MAVFGNMSSLRMQSPGGCTGAPRLPAGSGSRRPPAAGCSTLPGDPAGTAPAAAPRPSAAQVSSASFLSLRLLFHYKSKVIFFKVELFPEIRLITCRKELRVQRSVLVFFANTAHC